MRRRVVCKWKRLFQARVVGKEKRQCERTTVFQVASSGLVWPEFVGTIRCPNYD